MEPSDYYDYAPTVVLKKPLALIGPPSGEYRDVAYNLAALSGLSLNDLDHLVEHRIGRALWQLVRDEGWEVYRRHEGQLLASTLAARPCGILVLGDGALLAADNLRRVLDGATLVAFALAPEAVYEGICRRQASGPPHPAFPDPLPHADVLRPYLEARQEAWEQAHITIDLEGRSLRQVTAHLNQRLAALGA